MSGARGILLASPQVADPVSRTSQGEGARFNPVGDSSQDSRREPRMGDTPRHRFWPGSATAEMQRITSSVSLIVRSVSLVSTPFEPF